MVLKKLNDKLYISLQLYNGPEGASNRVFCTLKDQSQALVEAEFEVPHIANGFFSEGDKLMTAVDVIFAFFKITEADGTTISCEHAYNAQRYDRDYTGEQVQSLRPINATIIGEVSNANAVADVADIDSIIGEVEDIDVLGFTNDSDIVEDIEDSNITGEIQ